MVANSRTTTRTDAGRVPGDSALRLVAWDEDAADYHEPAAGALSPGDTVERYDYSPYGRRRVFGLTDALDVHGFHPLAQSQPIADPFGTVHHRANDVGFQGLHHNELLLPGAHVPVPTPSAVTPGRSPLGPDGSGLTTIHQRARDYAPWLGRFLQTDPLGYPDGLNPYAAYHVMWGGVDPWGLTRYPESDNVKLPDGRKYIRVDWNLWAHAETKSEFGDWSSWQETVPQARWVHVGYHAQFDEQSCECIYRQAFRQYADKRRSRERYRRDTSLVRYIYQSIDIETYGDDVVVGGASAVGAAVGTRIGGGVVGAAGGAVAGTATAEAIGAKARVLPGAHVEWKRLSPEQHIDEYRELEIQTKEVYWGDIQLGTKVRKVSVSSRSDCPEGTHFRREMEDGWGEWSETRRYIKYIE